MRKSIPFFVVLGLFLVPLRLMAQDTPKAEVFGGYQYLHLGGDFTGINANGWDASITGNITKHFGITGDFSGAYKTVSGVSGHLYTYGGGPVIAYDFGGKVNPFAHAIFGGFTLNAGFGGTSASTNGFAMKIGGGVDVEVNRTVAIRLAQLDWNYYHAQGTSESKNVSFAAGIVLRF
jgi:hypothetical protein